MFPLFFIFRSKIAVIIMYLFLPLYMKIPDLSFNLYVVEIIFYAHPMLHIKHQ